MATVQQMILSYKLKLDKTDASAYPDILEPEIKYWLDEAANRFVKQRYERTNIKRKGFEESQKRTDDLRLAVKTVNVIAASPNPNPDSIFTLDLPNDYRYLVKIKLNVTYDCNGVEKSEAVTPKQVEQDDIHVLLEDPFNKPTENKPLFIMEGNQIIVYTGNTATVVSADITYINLFYRLQPNTINFDGSTDHYINTDVYDALADDTHDEVVDIAVKLTLENIESQRYQSNSLEITQQE
jgi:hypothetical protein